jgi:cytochrome c-type protein NapC
MQGLFFIPDCSRRDIMTNNKVQERSRLSRFIGFLRQPAARLSVITLLSIGFVSGIVFWGGFHTGIEATNTLEFCTGCHEMRDTVYEEYKDTIHYSNRTGIKVTCSDCHVPKDWTHKMIRKAKASLELWGHFTGSIDTKAKFEAKRMELATNEWARMKASGSRECRNCHDFSDMKVRKQGPRAQKNHARAQEEGKTCIDCHKGIAHLLPQDYIEPEM